MVWCEQLPMQPMPTTPPGLATGRPTLRQVSRLKAIRVHRSTCEWPLSMRLAYAVATTVTSVIRLNVELLKH